MSYISEIFSRSIFSIPDYDERKSSLVTISIIFFFIVIEWLGRGNEYAIEKLGNNWSRSLRWIWYVFIIFLIGILSQTKETPFIYFQF